MNIKPNKTVAIGLGGISIPVKRMRQLRQSNVDALIDSFNKEGQLQPIVVRRKPGTGYMLIAGRHRLAAAKALKWSSISATVIDADNLSAEIAEIIENLVRADLFAAENALHTNRLKELYEKKYPATKHGAVGRGGLKKRSQNEVSFVRDAATKTGKSKATVERNATRGKQGKDWLKDIAGTSLDEGAEIDALIKLPKRERDKLIRAAKTGKRISAKPAVKKVKRAAREKALGEATKAASKSLGATLFNVIYADPPWKFERYSQDTGMDRAADNHYPTMTFDEMKTITVPAATDAVMFMWATVPKLLESMNLLAAWGFEYKSNYVWIKDRVGTGYWGRNKHELLLIGTRGNIPAPAPGTQPLSALPFPVDRHSAKPADFRAVIEKLFPSLPRLEMFARGEIAGWDTFGNEVVLSRRGDE